MYNCNCNIGHWCRVWLFASAQDLLRSYEAGEGRGGGLEQFLSVKHFCDIVQQRVPLPLTLPSANLVVVCFGFSRREVSRLFVVGSRELCFSRLMLWFVSHEDTILLSVSEGLAPSESLSKMDSLHAKVQGARLIETTLM